MNLLDIGRTFSCRKIPILHRFPAFNSAQVATRWLSEVETTVSLVSRLFFSTPSLVLLDSSSYASPYPLPILSLSSPYPLPILSLSSPYPLPILSLSSPYPLPILSLSSPYPLPINSCKIGTI